MRCKYVVHCFYCFLNEETDGTDGSSADLVPSLPLLRGSAESVVTEGCPQVPYPDRSVRVESLGSKISPLRVKKAGRLTAESHSVDCAMYP